jgi:hypothetical protein
MVAGFLPGFFIPAGWRRRDVSQRLFHRFSFFCVILGN